MSIFCSREETTRVRNCLQPHNRLKSALNSYFHATSIYQDCERNICNTVGYGIDKRIQDQSIVSSIKPKLTIDSLLIYLVYTSCKREIVFVLICLNGSLYNFRLATCTKHVNQERIHCQILKLSMKSLIYS